MYLEYIFMMIGIISALAALVLLLRLVITRNKFRIYHKILSDQTDTLDITSISATMKIGAATPQSIVAGIIKTQTQMMENTGELTPQQSLETSRQPELVSEDSPEQIKELKSGEFLFDGKYRIEREIFGGGMSRIFLARNTKLNNQWIVKFVHNTTGELANEENILKHLNHTNLPSIIDIFRDDYGTYLVESYIEGLSLWDVEKSEAQVSQSNIVDWFTQLAQVMAYLHSIKPYPIIHCDLKPSNIMITPDKNLVLIDFGISKFAHDGDDQYKAVTYKYAAPEQLKHRVKSEYISIIKDRFGELPEERADWHIDERTDIFSMGVIMHELVTGYIPLKYRKSRLYERVSFDIAKIIERCIELDPNDRYQNVKDILIDLEKAKSSISNMVKSIMLRRISAAGVIMFMLISAAAFAGSIYVINQENLAVIKLSPSLITVTEQESAPFSIDKYLPDGEQEVINASEIRWTFEDENVARISGDSVVGLNEGETSVTGYYKNKLISLGLRVVKPTETSTKISLNYNLPFMTVSFAGLNEFGEKDGNVNEASFTTPSSISEDSEGNVYLIDHMKIRRISPDGAVTSFAFEQEFIKPELIRCSGTDIYITTEPWFDSEEQFYKFALIRMRDINQSNTEIVYLGDGDFTHIDDFYVVYDDTGNYIYYLESVDMENATHLKVIDLNSGENSLLYSGFEHGDSLGDYTMAFGGDRIYVAEAESGLIQYFDMKDRTVKNLAGIFGDRHFVDGVAPRFYEILRLKVKDQDLYVLDFNILRRVNIEDGTFYNTETLVGEPVADFNPRPRDGSAWDTVFVHSVLADFLVRDEELIITDPKNGVIRKAVLDY
ncbi:MAG: protein kinase [Clostridiales bacterium]|jgi:tRNA A-37 threonylcarbamoyl transferase component Bud32|nr:protein kinase [Clostridiales bacterium]